MVEYANFIFILIYLKHHLKAVRATVGWAVEVKMP